MGSNSSGSFPLVLTKCASLGGAGWRFSWTQVPFSLASFFLWSFSFTRFRKLSRLLGCLICSIRTLILLARILPLLVYKNANSMLANIVDSSSFAMGTLVGRSFLNSAHSLDNYNITFLVDSHVWGQRNNSIFSKRPREHVAGAPPLSLCVGHFGELLEDGGSDTKAWWHCWYGHLARSASTGAHVGLVHQVSADIGSGGIRWGVLRPIRWYKIWARLNRREGLFIFFAFTHTVPVIPSFPRFAPWLLHSHPCFRLSSGLCPCWEASLHLSCTRNPCSGLPQHLCLPRSLRLPIVLEVFECLDLLPRQSHLGDWVCSSLCIHHLVHCLACNRVQ